MPFPYALNAVEIRVLGCLIEKQITTPDVYPLTLNSLTLACNQKSNRDPVMELKEETVLRGMDGIRDKKLGLMNSMAGSRVMKYSHEAGQALHLEVPELALLCELMLRGPQTAGELRGHVARMVSFASIEEIEQTLLALTNRQAESVAVLLPKQAGRKEPRYMHLLSGEVKTDGIPALSPGNSSPEKARLVVQAENERISKMEAEMIEMRQEMSIIQSRLSELCKILE